MFFQPGTLFWVFLCLLVRECLTTTAHSNAFHLLPSPSREELLMQEATVETPQNASLNFNDNPENGRFSKQSDDKGVRIEVTKTDTFQRQQQQQRGRGIVSSISQQASNFGKGLLNFFRGSPNRRGGPMPYPGPPMMRPFLGPSPGFLPHGPPHHMAEPMGQDRVGPSFQGDSLQGGFLPSKKVYGPAPLTTLATSSTAINSTKIVLENPKAPCDFYTDSLCIESHPYPKDALRRAAQMDVQRLRHMMADVKEQNANVLVEGVSLQEEVLYTYEHYYGTENNNTHSYRDYGADGGFVCPSDIKYARLERAKSAQGKWKIVLNFDEFTQTVRLEKCLKPYSRCSYVFSYLNSECVQIYNYQRLVAWDRERGFHLDIFKVPTACSCHLRSSFILKSSTSTAVVPPEELLPSTDSSFLKKVDVEQSTLSTARLTQTSQPDPVPILVTSGSSGSPLQHFDYPQRRLPQMKPSRFQAITDATSVDATKVNGQQPLLRGPLVNNRPSIHHLRIPSFRLTSLGFGNNYNNNAVIGNARNHPQDAAQSEAADNHQLAAVHPRRAPDRRFPKRPALPSMPPGQNPHLPFRQRKNKLLGGHRVAEVNSKSKVQADSTVHSSRVNYNTNPISDFVRPWSG